MTFPRIMPSDCGLELNRLAQPGVGGMAAPLLLNHQERQLSRTVPHCQLLNVILIREHAEGARNLFAGIL